MRCYYASIFSLLLVLSSVSQTTPELLSDLQGSYANYISMVTKNCACLLQEYVLHVWSWVERPGRNVDFGEYLASSRSPYLLLAIVLYLALLAADYPALAN